MSKTMNFTVEEINLMCIYHTSDRYILIKEMETALPFVRDVEMRSLMANTLNKLYGTSDADFDALPLSPTWEGYDDDEEIPLPETS